MTAAVRASALCAFAFRASALRASSLRVIALPAVLFFAALLSACFNENRLADGGNGSETTNHIAGWIQDAGGAAAARTRVLLVRSDFNPLTDTIPPSMVDTTDAQGRYVFNYPGSGSFRLQAASLANGSGEGSREGLYGLNPVFHYSSGVQTLPILLLGPPGFLRVALPESIWAQGGHLFIPGTTFNADVGETRRTMLGPLPMMIVPTLAYTRNATGAWKVLARDLVIRSGATTDLALDSADTLVKAPAEWVLRLDTRSSGAAVAEDVSGFPLLVRLDSVNFDFAKVGGRGADIRFFKPDSTALPFEIERWDSAGRKAEIWVRVDTVKGNSDTQFLRMRNFTHGVNAASATVGAFQPADGFVGVWHLGTAAGDRPDATGNGHWGKPVNFEGNQKVEGMVGPADRFDGRDDFLDMGVVNVERELTLSVWLRPDRSRYLGSVFQKPTTTFPGDSKFAYELWQSHSDSDQVAFAVSNGPGYQWIRPNLNMTDWVLIHGTYDGRTLSVYCNGDLVGARTAGYASGLEQNDLGTLLGGYADNVYPYFHYSGIMDEARIESAARSPAWIRLSYQNQRADQTLVNIGQASSPVP